MRFLFKASHASWYIPYCAETEFDFINECKNTWSCFESIVILSNLSNPLTSVEFKDYW